MSEESKNKSIKETRKEIISNIAQALADRRKKRQVSLDKVSQALKIRIQYLKAMETGNWDELPGEVYLKGFLMRYAQYLGLNGSQLLTPYLGLTDKGSPPEEPDREKISEFDQEKASKGWVWIGLGVLMFVALIKFLKPEIQKAQNSQDPVSGQTQIQGHHPPQNLGKEGKPTEIKKGKHQIDIFTPHPLWLRIQTEIETFEGFIPQSTTWTWQGEGDFNVRLGHAKEVAMLFDGERVLLNQGQKKIKLPHEN